MFVRGEEEGACFLLQVLLFWTSVDFAFRLIAVSRLDIRFGFVRGSATGS
jgi:hypothetical protein